MFTVVDVETTGLSKGYHKITEIAAARVRDGEIIEHYQTLVNPQVRIPSFITRLTGINNEMVKDAPPIEHVLPGFLKFLGKDIFVAHNATFDFGFIGHNLVVYHKKELLNHRLCTRKLANRLFPELPRKRLQDLCKYLNIKNQQAHRALADVYATVDVFNTMLALLGEKGLKDIEEIIRFERNSIKRR